MWWIVYEKCGGCTETSCFPCHKQERSLKLKRVFSEDMPENALWGPRKEFRDLFDPSWRLFEFNEASDELFFRLKVSEEGKR